MGSFDSTKRRLYEILNEVHKGKIQLPDFQRGWVWDDDRIIGIIASIAKFFPIGAIMLLETGNESIKFKTKPIEGVVGVDGVKPEMLILDGQQRITSLYQAIVTNRVVTTRDSKGYEIKRWYYIDMVKALDPDTDLEEAIFSINENKIITENIGRKVVLDLSTEEREYENLMYPVCKIDEYAEWRKGFNKFWKYDPAKMELWDEFEEKIINNFNNYQIPIIIMKKDNPKEAVCQVFEKVNTGGISLTVFELLTATYAADNFDLKTDWENVKNKLKEYKVLTDISNTDFIQAVTLYSTFKKRLDAISSGKIEPPPVSAKRKDMLSLPLEDYQKYRDDIVKGFIKASKILNEIYFFNARDLPYNSQLIPMAAILAHLGKEIDNIGNKNKLIRWFWCGVFGELYGSAVETRYALDMMQVIDWIENDGEEPKTIYDANFSPSRLHTLRTRNSAAYKGIYALLMNGNIKDWLSATRIDFSTYFSESIDIHHIFPRSWCAKKGIRPNDFDCIINKTPLSGRTNRIVSGDAPSKYLVRLKRRARVDDNEFLKILESHLVNPDFLYKDDFYGFFYDRKEKILQKIEQAIGKKIPRDQSFEEEGKFVDDAVEGDEI